MENKRGIRFAEMQILKPLATVWQQLGFTGFLRSISIHANDTNSDVPDMNTGIPKKLIAGPRAKSAKKFLETIATKDLFSRKWKTLNE